METIVEKQYVIPIGTTILYDIDYAKTLRLLREVKRRVQSEKNTKRHFLESIETHTPTVRSFRIK
jgi:hypothetical protein